MKVLAQRTVSLNGRIVRQYLVGAPSLGCGRCFWLGPVPASYLSHRPALPVRRSNGCIESCSLVGLHGMRCDDSVREGFCVGGCDEFILRQAEQRSSSEIAEAILERCRQDFQIK
jgi:hypothetical protein